MSASGVFTRGALVGGLSLAASVGLGAQVEFGWTGRVVAVDPVLAAALPVNAGVEVGARAWGRYVFESTTADTVASPTDGQYPGAIVDWQVRLGIYSFDRDPASVLNGIDVVRDPLFAFYEALVGVRATPPLPGLGALDADVFLSSLGRSPLATDALPLSPPDLAAWDTASAGLFRPGSDTPLIDIELTALCAGPCPDSDGDAIADASDTCPFFPDPDQVDSDSNGRGDACECGDQNGDAGVNVRDLIAINLATFRPSLVSALCDTNKDGLCNVSDIVGANAEIFSPGNTSTCARQPLPGP